MTNFRILFSNPWLLFLLIPALVLVFGLYFRLSKKYRRTRNRIVSVVLQTLVFVLSISVLSGISFAYDIPNYTNEVILLVDMSHNTNAFAEERDALVMSILNDAQEKFQVGIVTFGKNQVRAALPFSNNAQSLFAQYNVAERPDYRATNIAGALLYASTIFNQDSIRGAKIVLISNGIETDGDAIAAITQIVAMGIRVDTVFLSAEAGAAVQLIGVDLPEELIIINESQNIGVRVQSSFVGPATIAMFVNGDQKSSSEVRLQAGIETFYFAHIFEQTGLFEICFVITSVNDFFPLNKSYFSYVFIELVNNILILERYDGESIALENLAIESGFYVARKNIIEAPMTIEQLSMFDQIILNNIANADLPYGFDELLHTYVYNLGGGLLTVGGHRQNEYEPDHFGILRPVANTYSMADMQGSLFQQMLPVEAIEFTPPIAIVVVIDKSGSMIPNPVEPSPLCDCHGQTRMYWARRAANEVVRHLSDRDYLGVISFSDIVTEVSRIERIAQNRTILQDRISGIQAGGGTIYSAAIEAAGRMLQNHAGDVARRHIIFLTDGMPNPPDRGVYQPIIAHWYNEVGITLTPVLISSAGMAVGGLNPHEIIREMAYLGGSRRIDENGEMQLRYHILDERTTPITTLPSIMRNEASNPMLTGPVFGYFNVRPSYRTGVWDGLATAALPQLGGFFGVRAHEARPHAPTPIGRNLRVPAIGSYSPLFAQWDYGEGRVGSFMSDLKGIQGSWSYEFMADIYGRRFVRNIIRGLFPNQSVQGRGDMTVQIRVPYVGRLEFNYTAQVVIYPRTQLTDGHNLVVTATRLANFMMNEAYDGQSTNIEIERSGQFFRGNIVFDEPGIYRIDIRLFNSNGVYISSFTKHTVFSYSREFNMFPNMITAERLLITIADRGGGQTIGRCLNYDIFETERIFADIHPYFDETFNPRIMFIIIAIALFLLDIAVRKFKFKWPWEVVRDHRTKAKTESIK